MKDKIFIFNRSLGKLAARSCAKNLSSEGEHTTIEIVEWSEDDTHCWAVAYFEIGKEDPDLHFVGGRPFRVENQEDFWKLAEMSFNLLKDLND